MKALSPIVRWLRSAKDLLGYGRRHGEIESEVESLRSYYNEKLNEMGLIIQYKSYELERRLNELEEYRRKTEHLLKIIDSLESEKRVN